MTGPAGDHETTDTDEWLAIARRNARSVQTMIGWIFWDPAAVANLDALGVPDPFGYIAGRAAPLRASSVGDSEAKGLSLIARGPRSGAGDAAAEPAALRPVDALNHRD